MTNPPGMPGSGQPEDQPPGPFDQPTQQAGGWPQGQAAQPGPGTWPTAGAGDQWEPAGPPQQGAPSPSAGAVQPVLAPSGALAPSGEPVLVQIGDISVTQTTVFTPSGSRPLNELQWSVTDMTVTSQTIPTWAIVCAIIFFLFCLLGLLFLLVKETVTKGTMQVTVHGSGFVHTTQIPIVATQQIADINARVNYARTLSASFPAVQPPPDQGPESGQQRGQGW